MTARGAKRKRVAANATATAPEPPLSPTPTPEVAPWGRRDWLTLAGLTLAGLLLFAWGSGGYPLWDPFETRNAASAVESAERGGLAMPWLDGAPDAGQPVLLHWAVRVSMALIGKSELAARLPAALAAVGGLLVLFYCVRQLRGYATALMAAGVLATLPQYVYLSRQAMPDTLLTACLTGSLGFFALGRFCEERRRLHLVLFYVCMGLGVLAKGPLALAITGMALGLFGMFQVDPSALRDPGRWAEGLKRLATRYEVGRGALTFLVVVAPWHLAAGMRSGTSVADAWLWTESLRHFTEAVGGHDGNADTYVATLLHGAYPWIGLVPLALLHLFQGAARVDDDLRFKGYVAVWGAAVFCLFTLAATKHEHYLLPLMPALAVLTALVFEAWFEEDPPWWVVPGLLISLGFTVLPIRDFLIEGAENILAVFADSRSVDQPGLDTALKVFFVAWAVAILFAAVRRRSWIPLGLLLAVAFGHVAYMSHVVVPAQSEGRHLRGYASLFERLREPDAQLYLYGDPAYSLHFYFGRERFVSLPGGDPAPLIERIANRQHAYIIAEYDELGELSNALRRVGRWFPIAQDHPDYVMLTNSTEAIGKR